MQTLASQKDARIMRQNLSGETMNVVTLFFSEHTSTTLPYCGLGILFSPSLFQKSPSIEGLFFALSPDRIAC